MEHQRRDFEAAVDRGHKRGRAAHAADPAKRKFVEGSRADKALQKIVTGIAPDGRVIEREAPKGTAIGVAIRPRPGFTERLEVDVQELEDAVAALVGHAHDQIGQFEGPQDGELVVVVAPSVWHVHTDNPASGVHVKAWFLFRPI